MARNRSSILIAIGAAVFIVGAGLALLAVKSGDDGGGQVRTAATSPATTPGSVTAAAGVAASFEIPKGKQAVAIKLGYVNAVAGFVKAKDKVNLFGLIKKDSLPPKAPLSPPPAAKLILADVEVLSVTAPSPGIADGKDHACAGPQPRRRRAGCVLHLVRGSLCLPCSQRPGRHHDTRTYGRRTVLMRNPRILVVDRNDDLAEQIKLAADTLRPRPEVRSCTRVGELGDVLTDDGPFDILVGGPTLSSRSGLARLELIRDELPGLTMLLAFSRRPEAAMRDIVRTGAIDLIKLPSTDDDLREALGRAMEIASKRAPTPAVASSNGARAAVAGPRQPGMVFTMSSATGGCGKTFLATNLAYLLSHYTGQRACIIDLDLQFGEVSTALRLRPRYTIFDALQRDDDEDADLEAHIEEYLVDPRDRLPRAGRAPKDPSEADRIDPPDVTRIIAGRAQPVRLRHRRHAGRSSPRSCWPRSTMSDLLYTMATLDLPSVRNMGVFLGTLERSRSQRQHPPDPQQGRDRRRHRRRPGHEALPAGLHGRAPVRQGSQPVDQPRHAGASSRRRRRRSAGAWSAGFKELLPEADQLRIAETARPGQAPLVPPPVPPQPAAS